MAEIATEGLETVLREGRKFGPPDDFKKRARMGSLEEYERLYRRSIDDPEAFVWIGLFEPTPSEFFAVRREFGLHDLAVEDAVKAHQRPKLEVYGDDLFVVLKTARYVDVFETVEFAEIQLFVGHDYVVSVRHGHENTTAYLVDACTGENANSACCPLASAVSVPLTP